MHARGVPIVCLVNTTTGREREYAIRPAAAKKRVVVIGGGPAGLEAARVLALRGHDVTLFERDQRARRTAAPEPSTCPAARNSRATCPGSSAKRSRAGVRLEFGVDATAAMVLARTSRLHRRRDRCGARPAGDSRNPVEPGRRSLRDPAAPDRRHRPRAGDRRRHPRRRRRACARRKRRRGRPGRSRQRSWRWTSRAGRAASRHGARATCPTSRSTWARPSRRLREHGATLWNGSRALRDSTASTSSSRRAPCCP